MSEKMVSSITGWIIYKKEEKNLTKENYNILRLLEAAREKKIDIKIFTPEQFELIITKSNECHSIFINDELHTLPDFILPRIGSGSNYFTLAVLRQLEHLGVYVCNTAQAIELVKDKLHCHQVMSFHNLPIPKTMLVKLLSETKSIDTKIVEREIGFPAVVKNITGSEGAGIYLTESASKFRDLMELVYVNNPDANIIIQKYIKASHGKDLRVLVVGGRIIACMQRTSGDGDFKANFSRGGSTESFVVTPEIEWLAIETTKITGLDIAGIDLLFDEEGFKICEANSSPGFKGLELAVGKNIAEQIIDYIIFRVQQKEKSKVC